jgi:NAD(P)-dependent dehydrogenase (short-subunit alcohol dehydrogenase family)
LESRSWFITGTSRGFGRIWATAALERGDRVVGTARKRDTMADLVATYPERMLALELDPSDRTAVFAAIGTAADHFGELDIIVNNAGYGQNGMVEEVTEAEARAQLDTNFFGPLWVVQAALPYLRERGRGHIVQVSSIGGIVGFAGLGIYNASKFALEGLTQALTQEVAALGIHVTLIEPGGFATGAEGAPPSAGQIDAYQRLRQGGNSRRTPDALGWPAASAQVVLQIVDSDAPPTRIFLGRAPLTMAESDYATRLQTWREWQHLSELAHGH